MLKRCLVIMALVAVAAFLDARGVGALIGAVLEAGAPFAGSIEGRAEAVVARERTAAMILARNPFDHVAGSLVARAGRASDAASVPVCDGVMVLVIASSDDPDGSLAALRAAGRSVVRGRGGEVNGKHVLFVGRDRVWLEGGSGLCQALLYGRGAAPEKVVANGIRGIGPTQYEIDRSVVERMIEDPSGVLGQARVAAVFESGRPAGVRVLSILPGSVLGGLGVQQGDVLKTINGFELANPEKALEAFARLRMAEHLTLALTRGGREVSVDYDVR